MTEKDEKHFRDSDVCWFCDEPFGLSSKQCKSINFMLINMESDTETIYSDSSISDDESVHSSDLDFIDDSDLTSESDWSSSDDSDIDYIPEFKKQNCFQDENYEYINVKFIDDKWVINFK